MLEVYGTEHIVYMCVCLVLMVVLLMLLKRFVPRDKMFIPVKLTAAVGLVLIVINRIVVARSRGGTFLDFIPDTYCSMMGFILPVVVLLFRPGTKIFQYAIFAGMIGGLITLFYPDFLVYFDSIFNIHPFTGLLYHTLMVLVFLEVLVCGYYTPSFRNWASFPVGLAFMVVFAVFGNTVLGQSNNMYLNAPLLPDTALTWWVAGILMLVLYTVCLQVYEMVRLPVREWSAAKAVQGIRGFFARKKKEDEEPLQRDEEKNT